jgi:hypothetical protein
VPLAVALGLAPAWSKLLKNQPTATPSWYRALSATGDDGGFPAFVGVSAADGHSGGGAGGGFGGGAAGGGSSGAG